MANRYWVGGTASWDGTAGTKWATTSGGAGGASVPTSVDDVFFTNLSTGTCTISAGNTGAQSINCTGFTGTLAGFAAITVSGSVTLVAGMTVTYGGTLTLNATATLTTAGKTIGPLTITAGAGTVTLGSDLTSSGAVTVNSGTFTTSVNNYNITATIFNSSNSNTRAISFNSSTITVSSSLFDAINFDTSTNLTFNANTSQINITGANAVLSGGGNTFYNVSFTSTAASSGGAIRGANTFNNLSFTGVTSVGLKVIALWANQTITGAFTCSAGINATMRHFFRSDIIGTTRTLTCAAVSLTDVDFRDITIAGAAAPATGTRLGDCKGNSGITFAAAANKYWNLAGGGNWSSTAWAVSSGGSPAVNNFPLAQDTCIFEATGLNSGSTVTLNAEYAIGSIDMSARTSNTMTFATGGNKPFVYGNWTNGSGSTVTGTQLRFGGRTTQSITSAGKTFPHSFYIEAPNTSIVMQDNFAAQDMNLIAANVFLDANNKNITLNGSLSAASAASKTIAIGSGVWSIGGSWGVSAPCSVTGDGTIRMTSASSKAFSGGGVSYGNVCLEQAGNGELLITGNNSFRNIQSSATGANTISMTFTTQSLSGTWTARGSAGNLLTISGGALVKTTPGVAANVNYVNINGNSASPSGLWYAGPNSVNTSSSGWVFQAAPTSANFFMFYGG